MRKLLAISAILFSLGASAQCADYPGDIRELYCTHYRLRYLCSAVHGPKGVKAKRFPTPPTSAFYTPRSRALGPHLYDIRHVEKSRIFIGTMYGLPFADGAIFCRMESFTQRNYKIKFSLHAGGYTE